MVSKLKRDWQRIYVVRYFLLNLVKLDLKNKYRRSKLGILWTVLYPMGLSAIMGVVFSVAFNYELAGYMPYVLSGILFWDLVSGAFGGGGYSLLSNDSYIRQCNNPLMMYTLKSSIVTIINFTIAMVSLCAWILVQDPLNILVGTASFPITIIIFFFFVWGGTTIAGYTCVQYRDYPMMIPLILQVLWYISPVFFQEDLFKSNKLVYTWFQWNPITHMLNLIRAPFINGVAPSVWDYAISILFVALIDIWAYYINEKKERDLIFYL